MSTNRATLRIYWQHVWEYKFFTLGLLFSLPFAIIIHQVIPPIIAAEILNRLASGDFTSGDLLGSFGVDLLLYAAFIIIGGTIIWRIAIYFAWKMEMFAVQDMHQTIFNHLASLDADFHANSFGGSLVSRTNKFIGSFFRIYETFIFQFYTLLIMFIAAAFVLWREVPYLVVALFALSLLYITVALKATKKVRDQHKVVAAKENKQTGYLADMVTNVMAVKGFSASKFETERYEDVTIDVRHSINRLMRISLVREAIFGGVTTSIMVAALTLATLSVVVYDAEVGIVLLVMYYTNNITVRLWDFAQSGLKNLNRGFGDASEATLTLLRKPTVLDPKNPKKIDHKKLIKTNPVISFNSIYFQHENEALFENFNLQIKPGETIGLVGHSGSGKTTLTSLLLRFKDIDDGSLMIGGIDVRDLTQDTLRSVISYVPQEPLLFHRGLDENIAYGKPGASKKDIEKAAKNANAHEFIQTLEDDYKTLVGERGVKLSGGQKQRVAIARALLKDAPILILDEATSALDSESEQLIQDALWRLMKGRTAIVIAHRLSTIQKMDRIIVLDNGKILEEGSHAELIKKKGHYAKLWSHQSGGFLQD